MNNLERFYLVSVIIGLIASIITIYLFVGSIPSPKISNAKGFGLFLLAVLVTYIWFGLTFYFYNRKIRRIASLSCRSCSKEQLTRYIIHQYATSFGFSRANTSAFPIGLALYPFWLIIGYLAYEYVGIIVVDDGVEVGNISYYFCLGSAFVPLFLFMLIDEVVRNLHKELH